MHNVCNKIHNTLTGYLIHDYLPQLTLAVLGQEPISLQLPHIPVKAFSQTDLF